ncbi:glycoside hydrolase family 5 protein [Aaosphaeria arxii CBS 175.79]|uniref:Glycoside hydrolase family 5 protein n=1 Tax=Aaosphaeria arxii CBS 175.79 TaxID=1450172 RepID=A0A6A5XUJ8_9PLEO|nr:glycoside hydrolase family 5 protein [Aaosphaeria arxii CBS 175.79]KAF2016310.1 glycoside hydrolase family 5 protein [Aaosphaeria arxii CBS 175.79]
MASNTSSSSPNSRNGWTRSNSILRVSGTSIVDGDGNKVILKGVGLGGHLNMENFITGFTGHEHEHREALTAVLGKEKADFYFGRFLDYFFTDKDAEFLASLGLNSIRVPINYRHFEDDMNPGVIKPEGFRLLDRIVNICARHNIYVIIDLHTAPGGQNQDWHCDSGITKALFWKFKNFQDRVANLWFEIAKHYRGNPVIAGYNPLNEPSDPDHVNLIAFYARVEKVIRIVDPEHMLFIDGNTYSMDFTRFPKTPLPNAVYACHDYSFLGFPRGGTYTGTPEQKAKLRSSFERKVKFMRDAGVPIYNGEFGPVYASAEENGMSAAQVNECRVALLREQLSIYRETDVNWSIWTYKDINYQGMVYADEGSAYMKLLAPFIQKKKDLSADFWGSNDDKVKERYEPLFKAFREWVPEHLHNKKYPSPLWTIERHVERVVRETLLSEYLGWEMAEYFDGKSEEELDELAASYKFENCKVRDELNAALSEDAKATGKSSRL